VATLAFHHNGIGDYVMSLPALRLLEQAAPPPLDIVCGECDAAMLYAEVRTRHRIQVTVRPGLFAHEIALPQKIPANDYDVFVSLATWQSEQIMTLAEMTAAPIKLGFFSSSNLRPEPQPRHDFDRLFSLAAPFRRGARLEQYAAPPQVLAAHPKSGKRLVVHADTRREKMWPIERYDSLLAQFAAMHPDVEVVVLNVRDDDLQRTLRFANTRVVRTSLLDAMALTASADFFVGVDSCMLHVADLCSIPGLALFGPTMPEQFGFRFSPGGRHIQANVDLASLTVDRVLESLVDVVEGG
jgi:ADP-heptose:LPS heptosyltransferase